jgi:hypothetical protein
LEFEFRIGPLHIFQDVDIYAIGGDLIFNSVTETVYLNTPVRLETTENFYSHRPIEINRGLGNTDFTLFIHKHWRCTAPITVIDNQTSSTLISSYQLGSADIESDCIIRSNSYLDHLHVRPSCSKDDGNKCD